jgi:secretion/DNA translocation related TadE-like protein
VFGIGLVGLLTVLALVAAGIVGLLDAHRRAEAAADLAALAGGGALVEGRDACGVAAEVAHRNGASLTRCRADAETVAVVVTVAGPRLLGLAARLPGRARAGPVGAGAAAPRAPG